MNRHLHRVVFNAARGLRMAVAECASASGPRASRAASASAALLVLITAPALAQIKVDRSAPGHQRPTVLSTANGVPLVNIQTPSAGGVSLNKYSQFDIGPRGAVLNNSRKDVGTQIGGWVPGNPWLAAGPARVIVNQVNSHNPSHLNGPIEVAGQRAEVVVANPAGLKVNGASFINALGVTLTTGVPQFNNGSLESFRVTQGMLSIEGLGLDLSAVDHARILARAMEVNAGLWAQHLTAVTGSNEVKALASGADAQATPIAGTGAAPDFLLDVGAIGGMYAQHIFLRGTDKGLGVNLGGTLAARERMELLSDGRLVVKGSVQSEGDLSVKAAGVDNAAGAQMVARQGLSIEAAGGLNNAGLIDGQRTRVQAHALRNQGSLQGSAGLSVQASGIENASTGQIASRQALALRTEGELSNAGLIDGADVAVQAGEVHNSGRLYGDRLAIQADKVTNAENALIAARGDLSIQARDAIANQRGALILSVGDMALAADRLENRSARIEALGDLDIEARVLLNANDHLQTEVIRDGGTTTTRTLYFTPSGEVDASDVAWMAVRPIAEHNGNDYIAHGRPWLFTQASAQALAKSDPVFADPRLASWYHGPEPYVAAGMVSVGSGDSETYAWAEAQFAYGRGDPIWAALGITPPAGDPPGPMPRPPSFDSEAGGGSDPTYQPALEQWQAQAAPWIALGEKLAAVRSAINAELRPFDIYQTVTETQPVLKTVHSEPGQILSGGNSRLNVSEHFTNQDSEIVAGGTLSALGVAANNQATQMPAERIRTGTAYTWGVTGRDCDLVDCDPEYGWVESAIDQRIPIQLKVSALRHEQGAADAPTAPSVNLGSALSSALFRPSADPAATYLIETDPRFTERRQWLSSDAQLALMGVDPATVQKRLGDGFIEQRLVREQIAQLTGQRFLGDYRDDEAQYSALLEAGASFAQAHELRPGIALSAEQVAALTSDIVWLQAQTITLPDGSTQTALVPKLYLKPREGDLQPEGPSGALIAGRQVQLDLSGDFLNSGSVAGRELVLIDAQGIQSSGRIGSQGVTALRAREDIDVQGGEVAAKDALLLDAGRDIRVASTSAQSTDGQALVLDRMARLYVSGEAGALIAQAGRDIELKAALAQADAVDIHAGRDLRLSTLDTREALDATRDEKNYGRVQRSAEVGSAIGGAEVNLSAGRDVHMRAAQVQANGDPDTEVPYYEQDNNGRLSIHAGRNLDVTAGEASYQVEHGLYAKSSGLLGSSSTETRRLDGHTSAQGSALGGRNVDLSAGGDITFKGSHAIADENLDVNAGGSVRVLAERTEHRQERFREEKTSGLYGSGAGITLGSQEQSSEQQVSGMGAAASTLGALRGDVSVRAGQTYEQVGSDLLAPQGDIDVRAQDVRVTEARTTEERWQEDRMRQGGLTLGLGGAAVQAMQAFAETVEAIGNTDDKRMQALGAATAGLQVKQGMDAVAKAQADGDASGGVSVNISIGAASSRSRSEGRSDEAQGSRVLAGGDIRFIAEGAGEDSDILIRGSELNAGKTARLKAEGKVDLRAAENRTKESTESENHAGSVGIGFQLGGGGAGVGVTFSASAGKGNAEGESLTHSNTHVKAGERVVIESGGDTVLAGAVVSAERIEADIGGKLLIESLQDSARYKERSRQSSASATVGAGAGGSISSSSSNIDSEYASVGEQSALRAGDGGFEVKVKGKTTLKGGAITSTQAAVDEGRNGFESAGGLELEDVRNEARYTAKASGATVGVGGQLGSSGAGVGSDDGQASSTTQAAISGIAGNKDARTGDAERGIAPIFDKEKVKDEVNAQVVITKGFGQQAVPVAANYADRKAVALRQEGKEEEARKWDEGGEYRVGLHAAIGLLTGGVPGAVGAGAGAAIVPVVGEAIADLNLPEPVRQALTQVAGAGLGAVGGGAGAAASLNQTAHNYVPHSPYREVNRRVSRENARLNNECGANCTAEDFRRIDQQMAQLERAGTLAEFGKRSTLTSEQARQMAQLAVELAPLYGTGESLVQMITGKSTVTGEEASRFWAAVGVVPVAGGVLKKVGEPAVDGLAAVFKGEEAAKSVGKIVAKDGTAIDGLTKHGVDRVIGDGGKRAGTRPEAILDALKNPTKIQEGIDSQGRPFKIYQGQNARVVTNPESGKIISTNPLSGAGAH